MAHLLVVESWVGSMSRLLPRALEGAGHHFTFLTRDLQHYLRSAPEGTAHPLLTARNVVTAPTNDLGELLPQVQRLHEALHFDGVVTSCDYYLPAAARIAGLLGLPGPSAEAMENACRKDATRRVLSAAGVPGPRFAVCADGAEAAVAARDLGYPLVVKPVDLCAGMFVRRVDDEDQLAEACAAQAAFPYNARGQRRTPHVLLEEFLRGPEVSVETVTCRGVAHVVGVTDKSVGGAPAFVETGHMFPAALSPGDLAAATGTALSAGAALGLDDVVAHTEIKLTEGGPRVVEVNPRPAGNRITELVRHVTGIDLATACIDVALGRDPDLRPLDTGMRSAAIGFLVPDHAGTLASVEGADRVREAHGVLEVRIAEPGRTVEAADSNNAYLGHVMAGDTAGLGARDRVEALLAELRPLLVSS
ncbi:MULTISPECIES: ATP-grasp domain-containing protein [unclassified Streptomyces]|uniref:ATP-grasp domain-containing protein n=1 Tax=unclassified Streptomyces TaxID=2593676 RepID=UPI002E140FC8|nr:MULTISPECIES: ATP-grasp domain-containing protein [unclassified Streptomyces]WSQ76026.1 ATP-grasp domain-containing protein [Streptomyces sp. NBC_01213]WSR10697.1 ATP-grasp domain-containing protein [Streptomyces sp. NBC_01208]WSR46607.1 ATP-grasp domain-containing protein [Streptomyces sp. NBC_01201]